jgi:gamma-glutamyltranspeptidase/glutathione hydrolase
LTEPGADGPVVREGALVPAITVYGARGVVTSPHHLASQAGSAVLRGGGSAVDAAIATNAALAVVASSMCGLGGDAFWLIWDGQRQYALNGSGRSAAGASLESARALGLTRIPLHHPWSVTVPGAVRSWGDAHARFGQLPWSMLLEPAIELAEGFAASPRWVATIEAAARVYSSESDWARVFRPRGRPWRVGERVVITGLAATLRRLAQEGPDAPYGGSLARRAAEYLAGAGSPLRAADLAEHRSDWAEPIAFDYRGVTATSHPANSCGPVALLLLGLLATHDAPAPAAFGPAGPTDVAWIHLGLEASRLALAERDLGLTDPDWMTADDLGSMWSAKRIAQRAGRLDPTRAADPRPLAAPAGGGTVYLATADRWGGLVSLIESNYAGFGSGLVDPQTGIAYQDRGAFFSLDAAHPNALAPRKRTMHTLTPGMLFRAGRPWIAHGSMGGEIQPQLFAQFVSALVDGGLDIATAVAAPRWAADVPGHYQPPSRTVLESRFPAEIAAGLERLGHQVEWTTAFDPSMGHEHAVELILDPAGEDSAPTAAATADPRSEGLPAAG